MEKRVLVTGAAGFIGFHLALALKARGDRVLGFDNFNDYYCQELKKARYRELQKHGIDVINGDICDAAALEKAYKKHQPTHLAHLAAQAGVRYSLENPLTYIKSNIEGFTHILELCRKHVGTHLVYASSSSVYGLNQKIPFDEDDKSDQPASLYGATKKSNELLAHSYHHLFGVESIGLRFFTVYGPWGRPDMAYYSFAKNIAMGKEIQLFNHGEMKRDFTYIDDIVQGILAALDRCSGYKILNLGNHHPEPLIQLVETLETLLGRKARKVLMPMQQGDVKETYASIEKSHKFLGFSPKTPLLQGLTHFVKWFLSYHSLKVNV